MTRWDTNVSVQPFRYFRPEAEEVPAESVENMIKEDHLVKLNQNLYASKVAILLEKASRKSKGLARLTLFHKKEKGWERYNVPVDKSGAIPLDIMIFRLMDEADGDRQGSMRNIWIDIGINAATHFPPDKLGETYLWYRYPNEGDVDYVDDANSKVAEVVSKEDAQGRQRHMMLIGGTPAQREEIVKHIQTNFTLSERKVLAGCILEITPLKGGYAGMFYLHEQRGDIPRMGHICVDPHYLTNYTDVTVHEAIHALRRLDPHREGVLKAPPVYAGRDADFEESTTEAEAVIRQRPFTKDKLLTGYYGHIPETSKRDEAEIVREDRVTGTDAKELPEPLEHPQKGKVATKKVIKNYPQMHISKLKYKGNVEAIDTFFKLQKGQEIVGMQLYDPKHPSEAEAESFARGLAPKVLEWHDGKAEVIKDTTEAPPPRTKERGNGLRRHEYRGSPSHVHSRRHRSGNRMGASKI